MANYNQVGYGSNDKETVTELQKLLNQNGKYNLDEDGIFGDKTLAAVKDYQNNNNLAVDGIVGKNTWSALTGASNSSGGSSSSSSTEDQSPKNEGYKPSDTVTQAEALLQQHLAQKPGDYTSPWQAQLNDIIQKIQNREKFSYDLNGDALYQQYKDQYMNQGKMAMMDTMGQAQAMTGGYGNSYAQSVGQQAYQGYLQQLNDKVPELYQLALSQYNNEGDALYNQYALMAQMENQDYGRYRDQVGDYYTDLDRLTNDSRYQAEMDYGRYRDQVADQQWKAQFDEAKRQYDQQYARSTKGGGTQPVAKDELSDIPFEKWGFGSSNAATEHLLEIYAGENGDAALYNYLMTKVAYGELDPTRVDDIRLAIHQLAHPVKTQDFTGINTVADWISAGKPSYTQSPTYWYLRGSKQ